MNRALLRMMRSLTRAALCGEGFIEEREDMASSQCCLREERKDQKREKYELGASDVARAI